MNTQKIIIDLPFLHRLFPFHLLIDRQLKIRSSGKSLQVIREIEFGADFFSLFTISRPRLLDLQSVDLASLKGQLVILEFLSTQEKKYTLRGQIDYLEKEASFLFTGSPWFSSMDELIASNLTLHNFALHDPMIDLLHVLKTQDITMDDVQMLLRKVNKHNDILIESELKYRSIVEKATDIIYTINADGFFTYVNEVTERMTAYSQTELLTMRYVDLIRPDYRKKAVAFYLKQIRKKIPSTYFEFPLITKTGKEIWIGQSVQFPQSNEDKVELTALAIDINSRKHIEMSLKFQEEKYRNIITNMNLGLLEVDLDDRIQWVNQMFSQISGFSQQELIGKRAIDLLLDQESKDIIANKQHEREHGKSDMYSIPVKNKKGEKRWWLISGAPQYNDNGEIIGSIGVHLDVTEQKKLEEELVQAKIKAEDSSKAKEFFLATMSHEIRTPLNAIVGLSDLMQMDKNAISEDNIKILNFSSKNLHALITGILDLTKIDAGKIELVKNNFNLLALLESVQLSFKASCDDKNIDLCLETSDKIPKILIGDELRLSQILNNLISNAIKFTSKGFVKIRVECPMQEKDTARILFTISDSGIGIRKKNLKTIFRAFEQADRNIVRQFGGTGLGLSITQKLIHLHGSEIYVTSKLNKGSVFTFHIDYPIFMHNEEMGNVKPVVNFLHGDSLIGKRILLVEDNQVNHLIAVSYLNHWNIITDIANNGKEAIEKLEMHSYDLVLLDIFMPVMDGFETTKKIRHNPAWKTLPIIALTASAETNLIDKIIRLGANLCLTKPVDSKELFQALCSFFVQEQMKELPSTNSKKINTSKVKMPSLSLQKIEDASLGSSKFLQEMIALLLLEIPQTIQEAEDQLRHKNFLSFSATIHKLKNNLLMLSMDYLREDLNFLEEHAKVTNVSTKLRPVFKRLKECWEVSALELKGMQTL